MFIYQFIISVSPSRDFTDVLMGTTLVGGSLYLASRPHLAAIKDTKQKALFRLTSNLNLITLMNLYEFNLYSLHLSVFMAPPFSHWVHFFCGQ